MLKAIAVKIFGSSHDREMKKIRPLVDRINELEKSIKSLSDEQLKAKTSVFKEQLSNGASLDDILPEAFAVCRETSCRTLKMRHYDVQLIGGYILHKGRIAEMKTGEGKTLVATLPIYLNALLGKGVHLVTVNDYLATRDADWMGQIYKFLELSVGVVTHNQSDKERKLAYNSDILYATNNELGFDYLRDHMKYHLQDYVQRDHYFSIVDECDSILIDEARTPLIISGPAEESTDKYTKINRIIPSLQKEIHFTIEEKSKSAMLTEDGNNTVEKLLNIDNLYDPKHIELLHHIYQALKAHHLYNKDVDYMIKDGEIVIVDEFTGRLQPGRRWSDGLHQAIEAKEHVQVKNENQTLASITYQNYFRMYDKLAGMTGTADTEAVEFQKIYNLGVTVVPTNEPIARIDYDDVIYKTENAKFKAIAKDIEEKNKKGQPILVGTVSIEKSEKISNFLSQLNVKHNILNAKHHEKEAEIIAQAGRKGAVTIATNMAGRGTDIVLGGNPDILTKTLEPNESKRQEVYQKYIVQCEEEKKKVIEAGGLHIIGTERHESRRIDNQLRGRSGRQGDPGSSLFYLSLEDNLMRIFGGERIQKIMNRLNVPDDEAIVSSMVSRAIEGAQKKVEGHNFDIRKHLIDYDDVMNKQRKTIYALRRQVLDGDNIDTIVKEYLGEMTSILLDQYAPETSDPKTWELEKLRVALHQQFAVDLHHEEIDWTSQSLTDKIKSLVGDRFEAQKAHLAVHYDQIKKMILLQTIDIKWKDHLQVVDHIRESVSLRGYAQKDPLIEYKKEAYAAFETMDQAIKTETLEKLFKIQIVANRTNELEDDMGYGQAPSDMEMQSGEDLTQFSGRHLPPQATDRSNGMKARIQSKTPFVRQGAKPGRNDPCYCGSGKKYKKCHGR